MRKWIIADLHFGHGNIIKYCNRPFKDATDMDARLIKNWNSRVAKDDLVYVLGDFSLSRDKDYLRNIIRQLHGRKILIMGNHDSLKPNVYVSLGFEVAVRKPVLVEPKVVFMHEPPRAHEICDGMFYIFGHIHNLEIDIEKNNSVLCVSVEKINYMPISWDSVMEKVGAPY